MVLRAATLWLCLAVTSSAGAVTRAGEVDWRVKAGQAMDEAGRSGRPVLVDVWAVWCQPCKEMDRTTYRDTGVLEAFEDFVALKIDADLQENFIFRYRIEAYPTVLFLDADGDEILRLTGAVSARRLLKAMGAVGSGYHDYLTAKTHREDPEALVWIGDYLGQVGNAEGAILALRRATRALSKTAPQRAERVELRLAELLLDDERFGPAAKTLDRLYQTASEREVRAAALAALSRLERKRGKEKRAFALAEQVWSEFPDLAGTLLAERRR